MPSYVTNRSSRARLGAWAVAAAMLAATFVPARPAQAVGETLSIDDVSIVEGDVGTKNLRFTVTLNVPPTQEITVDYATVDGSATAGASGDYVHTAGTLTWAFPADASVMTMPIDVPINGDIVIEPNETFTVRLSNPTGGATITKADGIGTITNDDPKVSVASAQIVEGNTGTSTMDFVVSLSGPSTEQVTVNYTTKDGSATDGLDASGAASTTEDNDYVKRFGVLTFAPGTTQMSVPVTINGDVEPEGNETFTFELSAPTNAFLGVAVATGTILGDDPIPTLVFDDVTAPEGDVGARLAVEVPVRLTDGQGNTTSTSFDVTVRYRTAPDPSVSATTPQDATVRDGDYERVPATGSTATDVSVTIPAGQSLGALPVTILGDAKYEQDEQFTLMISLPEDEPAVLDRTSAQVTITNDDAVPLLRIEDGQGVEGSAFNTALILPVTLDRPSYQAIKVNYSTVNGTAIAGEDYNAKATTLTIPVGSTTADVSVQVIADDVEEPDETFTVEVTPATGSGDVTLERVVGTATIINDDGPRLTVEDTSGFEGDEGLTDLTFTISLDEARDDGKDVTVDWLSVDDTAVGGGDDFEDASGTATIPAGELSTTVVVKVVGDTDVEDDETLTVALSNPKNALMQDAVATGTIVNDDDPPPPPEPNEDPIAVISAPATAGEGAEVTFDGAGSSDVDGEITEFRWVFGDNSGAASGESVTHRFPDDGTYTVALRVKDDDGAIDIATVEIVISNVAPTALLATSRDQIEPFVDAQFNGGASDPGSDTFSYSWDFGDDSQKVATKNAVHQFDEPGTYDVVLTVTDDDGGSDTETLQFEVVADSGQVTRVAGEDRIGSALQVAQAWDSAPDVVLAVAWDFPDALAGGALTNLLRAPLLLTDRETLSDGISDALTRLGTERVWILGGTAAVGEGVEDALEAKGYEVHRFAGADRYHTAALVALGLGASIDGEVMLALGDHPVPSRAWPDALSAGALGASPAGIPTLLTQPDSLPEITEQTLEAIGAVTVYVVGGEQAIAPAVVTRLEALGYTVVRLAGADRYATSVEAATAALQTLPETGTVPLVLATGANYPDGLAAAARAAHDGGIVLLVPPGGFDATSPTHAFLSQHAHRFDVATFIGGTTAMSDAVLAQVAAAMSA